jgi:hypothetical protein
MARRPGNPSRGAVALLAGSVATYAALATPLLFVAILWHEAAASPLDMLALGLAYAADLVYLWAAIPAVLYLGRNGRRLWLAGCLTAGAICAARAAATLAGSPVPPLSVPGEVLGAAGAAVVLGVALVRRPRRRGGVELTFPLACGTYAVVQGGAKPFNHHATVRAQAEALDVVRIGPRGARDGGPWLTSVHDFVSYRVPVRSPCDGQVEACRDDLPDAPPGEVRALAEPAGNTVVLRSGDVRIVLAHLAPGSICVRPGQVVHAGDPLGEIGNSGRSSEPHLHLHAERDGIGVPMLFGGRSLQRNDLITMEEANG